MNNLFEQFENHAIFQTIANKIDIINKALISDTYNEQQKESLMAYKQLLTIIQVNLSSKALPMVCVSVLNNLNTAISALKTNIVTNINGYPTQYQAVMDWFKRIPTIEKKSEIKESFNSLIDNFINRQEKITANINQEIEDFQNKQNKEFESWISEKKEMQTEIDDLKEQNCELKDKLVSFEQTIKTQQSKINDLISKFCSEYEENTEDFENRFTEKENEYNTKIETLLNTQKDNANGILDHLERRKNEIEKLWGIIGQSAISGNSQNYANKAKLTADIMMYITLAIMSIVVLVLSITTYLDFKNGTFNYIHFMYKIIGSTIFLVPAFYCSNISKRHRDREFQLRDFEVKTAALEPFMENMIIENRAGSQDINKDKIKLELTKTFFDKQFNAYGKSNDCVVLPKEIAKILNNFAKKCNFNINLGDKDEQNGQ